MNIKNRTQVEALFLLSKEAQNKSVLHEYHTQRQAMSRFFLGAMILSDPVIEIIRRELRRVSPGVKIESEEIRSSILTEVLKREVVEGDKFEDARKKIGRAQTRALRVRAARANGAETEVEFAGSEAETPDIVAATEE